MEIYTNFAVQTLVNLIIYYFGKSWVIKQASKMNDEKALLAFELHKGPKTYFTA